jgi:hypothetical protein
LSGRIVAARGGALVAGAQAAPSNMEIAVNDRWRWKRDPEGEATGPATHYGRRTCCEKRWQKWPVNRAKASVDDHHDGVEQNEMLPHSCTGLHQPESLGPAPLPG